MVLLFLSLSMVSLAALQGAYDRSPHNERLAFGCTPIARAICAGHVLAEPELFFASWTLQHPSSHTRKKQNAIATHVAAGNLEQVTQEVEGERKRDIYAWQLQTDAVFSTYCFKPVRRSHWSYFGFGIGQQSIAPEVIMPILFEFAAVHERTFSPQTPKLSQSEDESLTILSRLF